MRVVTPDQDLVLKGPGTLSYYYVDLLLDEQLHMTNGKERDINGALYKNRIMGELSFSQQQAVIAVGNPDGIYTMRGINGDFYRNPVRIMSAPGDNTTRLQLLEPDYVEPDYYEQPLAAVDPIVEFSGHIAYVERVTENYIYFVASRNVARRFPRGRIISPYANYQAQSGAVINFGSKVIRIESRLKRGTVS